MLYGVIMAGGSGTRLWPRSRRSRPKQLLNLAGEGPMIRATVERILPKIPFERIIVVTGAAHAEKVRDQLPELTREAVVAEPQGRNTAACIALAAYKVAKLDPEAVMVVLPADHLMGKEEEFRQALEIAAEAASGGDVLVTFGIVPDRAETGYGYIRLGDEAFSVGDTKVFSVESFVEKPDRATAEEYLASGRFLWNSGMFVWTTTAIVNAFDRHLPETAEAMAIVSRALNTNYETEAIAWAYNRIQSVSIDHAILEKARNVLCIPIDVEWNDVGSWASLEGVWEPDDTGNTVDGQAVMLECKGCIVSSPDKPATMIGIEDLVIVDTPDVLLVCRKDRAQDVKKLREMLKEKGYENLL